MVSSFPVVVLSTRFDSLDFEALRPYLASDFTYSTQGVAKVKRLNEPWIIPEKYLIRLWVERRNEVLFNEAGFHIFFVFAG